MAWHTAQALPRLYLLSPAPPLHLHAYRGKARLDKDGVSGGMAGAGDGTSKAGGRSKPGDGFLEVNTDTCGYYCRGGLGTLTPSPVINGSNQVLAVTHLHLTLTSTFGIVTIRFGGHPDWWVAGTGTFDRCKSRPVLRQNRVTALPPHSSQYNVFTLSRPVGWGRVGERGTLAAPTTYNNEVAY